MLDKLGQEYNTDKASSQRKVDPSTGHLSTDRIAGHDYLNRYELLLPAPQKPINFLEVGCCGSAWRNGAGLRTFLEYYKSSDSRFFGMDIKPIVSELRGIDPRLSIIQADCSKDGFLDIIPEDICFDVIIEDGSHFWSHQKVACRECIRRLKPGGYLIIEDVHTSFLSAERYADGESLDFASEAIGTTLSLLSKKEHRLKRDLPELDGVSANSDLESITYIPSAILFRRRFDITAKRYEGKFYVP
jgi:SAM-dependent methyltransferase